MPYLKATASIKPIQAWTFLYLCEHWSLSQQYIENIPLGIKATRINGYLTVTLQNTVREMGRREVGFSLFPKNKSQNLRLHKQRGEWDNSEANNFSPLSL